MLRRNLVFVPAAALLLSGCTVGQSALDVHGENARQLLRLIWIFSGLSLLIWLAVIGGLALALFRNRSEPEAEPDERGRRSASRVVAVATGLTAIIIIGLTALSYVADRSLASYPARPVTIRITGNQWWWEVRYESPEPSRTLQSANEIHIPVGTPVRLKLESTDVIHSFWVPSLAGKEDLVPGRHNELTLLAERPGIYRGQCAEFCGLQHAHMAVLVIAEPQEEFQAWWDRQLAQAPEPPTEEAVRGRTTFLSGSCILCHTVRGTSAGGKSGPDLTHVGSRRTIAAGILPMTRDALATWIADPQGTKPGANMPVSDINAGEIKDVAAYLESLK